MKNLTEFQKTLLIAIPIIIIIVAVLIITSSYLNEKFKRDMKNHQKDRAELMKRWNEFYPEAKGKTYHTFCDKNGFLKEVTLYDSVIGQENLVKADNDVPVRCNPDNFNVIERTGKNSTVF